jgi:hypothetical protein
MMSKIILILFRGQSMELQIDLLSRSDLSSFFMSLFWFGQGVSWGGHSMLFILCFVLCVVFLCVYPDMVPNQRQLSIVVSD